LGVQENSKFEANLGCLLLVSKQQTKKKKKKKEMRDGHHYRSYLPDGILQTT
jgi:hypothetical protein